MTRITKRDIDRFTCGDCHVLARTIHRMTGWPINSYCGRRTPTWPTLHAFVELPNGKVLDVEGVSSYRAFARKWKPGRHRLQRRQYSLRETIKFWGRPNFGNYSYRRARQIAPILIEQAKAELSQ